MGLDDHVAAMRQLAAERPYVDLERAGITGLSFGGWTSLRAVLEFPDFFKAAVAGVPPGVLPAMYTDYHTTAYQGPPLYDDGSELRPTPQSKPLNYADADSAGQAVRLRAKLLIVLGELDENCLPASTLQFVDALIKADKEFDLLYMPSTTHGGTVQPYAIHRIWDFFVRHLQGIEPPTGVDSSKESAG
jgi:dipeptidyl aminopeptidase/acylaminoacyl peptidase